MNNDDKSTPGNAKALTQPSALPLRHWWHGRKAKAVAVLITSAALVIAAVVVRQARLGEAAYQGRPIADWVREALDGQHGAQTTNARFVVSTQLREKAVPYIIRELNRRQHATMYLKAVIFCAFHAPKLVRFLPEPENTKGAVNAAAFMLAEMGEAGRPGWAAVARCLDHCAMSIPEAIEVMDQLVQLGPDGAGAVRSLRRIAETDNHLLNTQAALAVFNTARDTNLLTRAIRRQLRDLQGFNQFERELFWFRDDETVNAVALPPICEALAQESRPEDERKAIARHLGRLITTNPLPAEALQHVINSAKCDDLREVAKAALAQLTESQARLRKPGTADFRVSQ